MYTQDFYLNLIKEKEEISLLEKIISVKSVSIKYPKIVTVKNLSA